MVTVVDKRKTNEDLSDTGEIKENPSETTNTEEISAAEMPQNSSQTEESGSDNAGEDIGGENENIPLSPDQFFSLLSSLMLQLPPTVMLEFMLQMTLERAWTTLGLHADPVSGETEIDLNSSKKLIECADFLLNSAADSMSPDQAAQTRTALSTLKMNYADRVNS